MSATRRYAHPALGFALTLPERAELVEDLPDVALAVLDPEAEPVSAFRANLTVTVERVPDGTDVEAYTEASLAAQDSLLAAHHTIDRASDGLAGRPSSRTLGHHVLDPLSVTLEQWRVVAADRAFTATFSCATLDYPALADGFAEIAESLEVGVPG